MSLLRPLLLILALVPGVFGLSLAEADLRYAGATTLQRFFMPEAARVFADQTDLLFSVEGGNTAPGLAALLKGEIDVAGAGRHLTEQEKSAGLVEYFLGWDMLSIVVNQANPVENLTREQLQAIFSGKIDHWQAVGGADLPIVVVTSPRGSGMRSSVQSLILGDSSYLKREVVAAIVAEADKQVMLFPSAITALSRSMVDEPGVKTIKVDAVEATAENLASGRYPLAKPLVLVTKGVPQGALASFIELATGPRGQEILARHFVPKIQ